jgi:hypothetical protein
LAKKTARSKKARGKKPASRTGRAPAGSPLALDAAKVFAELAFAVAQGAGEAMATNGDRRSYEFAPDARDLWLAGHAKSIPKALKNKDWPSERQRVIEVARTLGAFAIEFAIPDSKEEGKVVIELVHAEKAREKVQAVVPQCRAARRLLLGMFCAF